jgi:hypothetical protein
MRNSLIAAVALAAFTIGSARADNISFTYTGTGIDNLQGTVQLDGSLIAPNTYQIMDGTDTVIGGNTLFDGTFNILYNVSTGQSTSPSGYFYYDNLIFTDGSNTVVDIDGLLFTNGARGEINLYSNSNTGPYIHYDNTGFYENIVLSNVDVAEPSTVALFGIGLIGLGLAYRRREDMFGDARTVV